MGTWKYKCKFEQTYAENVGGELERQAESQSRRDETRKGRKDGEMREIDCLGGLSAMSSARCHFNCTPVRTLGLETALLAYPRQIHARMAPVAARVEVQQSALHWSEQPAEPGQHWVDTLTGLAEGLGIDLELTSTFPAIAGR